MNVCTKQSDKFLVSVSHSTPCRSPATTYLKSASDAFYSIFFELEQPFGVTKVVRGPLDSVLRWAGLRCYRLHFRRLVTQ